MSALAPIDQSTAARTWRRFLRHKLAVASLFVLALLDNS